MGLIVSNHPKMIAMWAKRLFEIRGKYGRTTAEKWANHMFPEKETMELINKELQRRTAQS